MRCYHVTTVKGAVYGVAATTKRDAMTFTQERLSVEGSEDAPARAEDAGSWAASYGTVLAYSDAVTTP